MPASNPRLLAAITLVVTFVVGAGVGVAIDHMVILHMMPKHTAEWITRRLDRRLHFNDQQRAQVVSIIDVHQKRIGTIWNGVHPAIRQEVDAASAEIDRVLTPEQRVTFQKIRANLMPRPSGDGIRFRHD